VAVKRDVRRSAGREVEDRTGAGHAAAKQPAGRVSAGRWAWEWLKSLFIAFALFLVIRTFLVEAFRIPTGSMEDTLLVGDFLLVNKAVFGSRIPVTGLRTPAFREPRPGDIVVFMPPHEPGKNYVKRVVAGPGDVVAMRDKVLLRNGQPLHEPYARYSDPTDVYSPGMFWQCDHLADPLARPSCRPSRDNWGPLTVPDGRYLMLGDNRDDSEDSRYWGFVDRASIKGKPLFIYYSFDPTGVRPIPWLTEIRWRRIGRGIH
jgi:signal peptidase I